MRSAGGKSGSGTVTKAKVEQLAPPGRSGTTLLWVAFWALAEQVGPHYVWRGAVDKRRGALFIPNKGPPLPAAHVAWAYDGRELGAREALRPSCNRKHCVRPEHQEVFGGAQ